MTCKDCSSYAVCVIVEKTDKICWANGCSSFKNKADFVEVVRCKDCANILHKNDISVVCKILGKVMITEDYCSYGAKKNEFKE